MACDFTIIREPLEDVFRKRRSTVLVLPSVDRLILNTARKIDGCWIAGGAPLALYTGDVYHIKDWDLFFRSQLEWKMAKKIFEDLSFVQTQESEWSVTFNLAGVDLQLVNRHWYEEMEDIFKKFDFSICCFAVDGEYLCYTKSAKYSEKRKEFDFIFTENLPTCIKRIARYGAKGYIPSTQFSVDIAKAFKRTKLDKIMKSKAKKDS